MVRELVILETLDSPNVIKVHEFIKTTNNFYMVQEYANGGSLQRLLDSRGRFTEAISKKILKQIIIIEEFSNWLKTIFIYET